MIVSIPTSAGMINLCLTARLLKIIACIVGIGMILAGYTLMQLVSFVMTASPEQFVRVILVACFVAIVFVVKNIAVCKAGGRL